MRLPLVFLALLLTALSSWALESAAQREIDFLIKRVAESGAVFVRNGSEYPAPRAAEHLRMKLGRAGDRVKSAEDFITGIASKSYLTGRTYYVQWPDGKREPAGEWMRRQLAAYRTR